MLARFSRLSPFSNPLLARCLVTFSMAQSNNYPSKSSKYKKKRKRNKKYQQYQQYQQSQDYHQQQSYNDEQKQKLQNNNDELLVIDGSIMEGGGQILRNSTAFAALMKRAIHITKIRGKRSTPGLRKQHSKGIQLVSKINGLSMKFLIINPLLFIKITTIQRIS